MGLGIDCRLESDKIAEFALIHSNTILHLSLFIRDDQGNGGRNTSGMRISGLGSRTLLKIDAPVRTGAP